MFLYFGSLDNEMHVLISLWIIKKYTGNNTLFDIGLLQEIIVLD